MNYVAPKPLPIENLHPLSHFFNISLNSHADFELIFLPTSQTLRLRPSSVLGLIFDYAALNVCQKNLTSMMPVELETFVHAESFPEHIIVKASIELLSAEHSLFYCEILAKQNHSPTLLAVSHGTLKAH